MIKKLRHSEIDFEKWDECVQRTKGGHIYGYSWWLNTVCSNWEALVEDNYQRVFPIPKFRKFGLACILQPPFTQYLSIYGETADVEKQKEFINHWPRYTASLHLRLGGFHKDVLKKFNPQRCFSQVLDLSSSYEKLRANYSKNYLKNEKIFLRYPLRFVIEDSPENTISMGKTYLEKKISSIPSTDYKKLDEVIRRSQKHLSCINVAVYLEEECLQSCQIKKDGNRLHIHSGFSEKAKQYRARYFMFDHIIRMFAGQNLLLDFGGSLLEGIRQFNLSFGSTDEGSYLIASKIYLARV